jgi:pimeloyl-ACP methyl ester carboxylesterase
MANVKTFVLVHGAWHGGWCWRRVADLLEADGHKVYTPTLTGLGERSHLLSETITLDTHITDVANVFEWEGLKDVVLVGHSYGGFVISGVAERVQPSISSIVFLDAFVPQNGENVLDLASTGSPVTQFAVAKKGIGRPAPPAKAFHVNEKDQAWVDSKTTPQPAGVSLTRIVLKGAREKVAKKIYVRATSYPSSRFDGYSEKFSQDPAWRTYKVQSGHDVMIDMPDRLTEILLEVA